MTPFWGKRESGDAAKAGDGGLAGSRHNGVERRLTVGLVRSEQLAMMLATSRAAKFVEVADMLAGMYIHEWDRLERFWGDREEVEELLRRICAISPQRWHHWIELYDKQRHQEEKELSSPLSRLGLGSRNSAGGEPENDPKLERSIELEAIFQSAGEISPFTDEVDGRAVPVLTTECVLLCIAQNTDSEISRKLRETGLDLAALERAARDPRRAPHR